MLNPIIFAVPVFLAMMAIEFAVDRRRLLGVYRAANTVSSLSLGIVSQLVSVITKLVTLGFYAWAYQCFAVWTLPADSPWVWLGALLGCDFCYFWLHRMGHQINLLWAAQGVHHSCEA